MTEMQLTSIFCITDDFCNQFSKEYRKRLIDSSKKKRKRFRNDCLSEAEIITILIWFNLSGFKCFKHFYMSYYNSLKPYFTRLPSYQRFVLLQRKAFVHINVFMKFLTNRMSKRTGIYYIDSTFLEVCKNKRIYRHKTFKNIAQRGVSSCGWFFGMKLHLVTNHIGDIVSFVITKGGVSDNKMATVLSKNLQGLLFGDKAYISFKITQDLLKQGLQLITKVRANMRPKPISETNKLLLRKRGIIETIFGNLKDFKHLVHTKYRSAINYFTNVLSALAAYMLNPNKPSICLDRIGVA